MITILIVLLALQCVATVIALVYACGHYRGVMHEIEDSYAMRSELVAMRDLVREISYSDDSPEARDTQKNAWELLVRKSWNPIP